MTHTLTKKLLIVIFLFITAFSYAQMAFRSATALEGVPENASYRLNGKEVLLEKYTFDQTPQIGTVQGVTIREGGISGISYRNGIFYLVSDRGPNVEAGKNGRAKGKTALVYPFTTYSPKVWAVRPDNGVLKIEKVVNLKRPDLLSVSGLTLPPHFGGNGEVLWSDTLATELPTDAWGLDSEGITVDKEGNFWVSDEYAVSIWKISPQGKVLQRFTPFPQSNADRQMDSVLAYRRPNRGLEGITCAPNGKLYAILQSPAWLPDAKTGNNSRLHRLIELDPVTGFLRTFLYEHAPATGDIKNQDWKIGDIAAINETEFLVIEHAEKGKTNVKNIYHIDISNATAILPNMAQNKQLEQLMDAETAIKAGVQPVKKSLFADLLTMGWELPHDKPEGLTIIDANTFAVINDNDYGIESTKSDGKISASGKTTRMYVYHLPPEMRMAFKPVSSFKQEQPMQAKSGKRQ